MTGLFTTIAWLCVHTRPDHHPRRPYWALPGLAFFLFSWSQMENWVWGWQLQVFLSIVAVGPGIALLAGPKVDGLRFSGALVAGIVASYSFANGMLYWVAALPVLLIAPGLKRNTLMLRTALWIGVALITIQTYRIGYKTPEVNPSLTAVLQAPLHCAGYLTLYLGSPVTAIFSPPAWHGPNPVPLAWYHFAPGMLGIAGFLGLLVHLIYKKRVSWLHLAPWLSLAAYAVGSALLTSAGRVGFGIGHALTSRYITISSFAAELPANPFLSRWRAYQATI